MIRAESDSLFRHLSRKKYIEAMKETDYGHTPQGSFEHVGCPSDLEFIYPEEEALGGSCCKCTCQECWEHILKNRKW